VIVLDENVVGRIKADLLAALAEPLVLGRLALPEDIFRSTQHCGCNESYACAAAVFCIA